MSYQRWTRIDPADPETLPPLHEHVLVFRRDPDMRSWCNFHSAEYREFVLTKFGYSHFREEMNLDSP